MDCSPLELLCHGIFEQEYWGDLRALTQGIFLTQGLHRLLWLCIAGSSFPLSHQGSPVSTYSFSNQRRPGSAVVPTGLMEKGCQMFRGYSCGIFRWLEASHSAYECILCLRFSKHILPQEQSNFFLLWLSVIYSGIIIILAKSWFGALWGLETFCVDSGSPENPEVFNSSLVTDCEVVMILNYC